MIYGYARISDKTQNIEAQVDQLREYGCEEVVEEVITGVAKEKDQLDQLVEKMQEGDELVVTRHDRLGRNTVQLLLLVDLLEKKNVRLNILNLGFDTRNPMGKAFVAMLSAFAQMERDILKEKQRIGIAAAKKRGKHLGRPVEYSKKSFEKAVIDYLDGMSVNDVSDTYNIPRSTFYRFLKEKGIKR